MASFYGPRLLITWRDPPGMGSIDQGCLKDSLVVSDLLDLEEYSCTSYNSDKEHLGSPKSFFLHSKESTDRLRPAKSYSKDHRLKESSNNTTGQCTSYNSHEEDPAPRFPSTKASSIGYIRKE
ncbi:hypothetical protein KM043_003607 [Ampulex compressa]|nr:hypothetical protein KM043_003607 [Ampulex compressa]